MLRAICIMSPPSWNNFPAGTRGGAGRRAGGRIRPSDLRSPGLSQPPCLTASATENPARRAALQGIITSPPPNPLPPFPYPVHAPAGPGRGRAYPATRGSERAAADRKLHPEKSAHRVKLTGDSQNFLNSCRSVLLYFLFFLKKKNLSFSSSSLEGVVRHAS